MFDAGKRFTPPMLSFLESESETADFVQGRQTHYSVNDPADNSCFTEQSGNKVEFEKTYQAPVEGSDEKQNRYNDVQNFHNMPPSIPKAVKFHSAPLLLYPVLKQ